MAKVDYNSLVYNRIVREMNNAINFMIKLDLKNTNEINKPIIETIIKTLESQKNMYSEVIGIKF